MGHKKLFLSLWPTQAGFVLCLALLIGSTLSAMPCVSCAYGQEVPPSPHTEEALDPPALVRLPADRNCIEKPEVERKACEKELVVFELGCMNHCWDTCRGSPSRSNSSCYPLCMESCRKNGFIEGPSEIGLQESCPPLQGLLGQLKAATEFQLCGLPCRIDPSKGLVMNTPHGFVCTITPAGKDPLGRQCLSFVCQKKF
jgi:hypothetical protein